MQASKHKYAAFQVDPKYICEDCADKAKYSSTSPDFRPNQATYKVKKLGSRGYNYYCLKHVQDYAHLVRVTLDEMLKVGRYLQGG